MTMSLLSRLMAADPPRWHGNGFVQLDLNARQRLHVWHPDWYPHPKHVSTVHDHVFDLTSEVLLGKVGHEVFGVDMVADGGSWKVYRVEGWCSGVRDYAGIDPSHAFIGWAHRRSLGSHLLAAGSQYSFPRYQFHESSHDGLTATLMTKSNGIDPTARPRVLCPWGYDSTDARAPGGPDEVTQWAIIEEALDKMWRTSQSRIEACIS